MKIQTQCNFVCRPAPSSTIVIDIITQAIADHAIITKAVTDYYIITQAVAKHTINDKNE